MGKKQTQTQNYVQISSTKTIQVTCGLQFQDVTNKDAHVPDRLRVLEKWSGFTILVRKGAYDYPIEILEWPTVKSLIEAKIFTVDGVAKETTNDDKAKEMKNRVEDMKKELPSLAEASEEATEEATEEASK